MNGPTEAQMFEIFEGPPSPGSQDWLLPAYQQPYYASQFPQGTFASILPEPAPRTGGSDWLTNLSQPFVNFGESLYKTSISAVEKTYEKLPELLWEKYMVKPKQRVVDEGAGVVVTHTQPPYAGGEPAKPIATTVPQWYPSWMGAAGGPQAKDTSTVVLIGAGLIVLYILTRGKG